VILYDLVDIQLRLGDGVLIQQHNPIDLLTEEVREHTDRILRRLQTGTQVIRRLGVVVLREVDKRLLEAVSRREMLSGINRGKVHAGYLTDHQTIKDGADTLLVKRGGHTGDIEADGHFRLLVFWCLLYEKVNQFNFLFNKRNFYRLLVKITREN